MEDNKSKDNIVFVGKKPAMSYAMAVVTQFSLGQDLVNIKARGKSISRAVDVAEVVRSRFYKDAGYSIDIGTEEVKDDMGRDVKISTINIKLSKN